MTIKYFSPNWYYHGKLPMLQREKIIKAFSDFINDDNNFQNKNQWSCNVLTSYDTDGKDMRWKTFQDCVSPCIKEFMDSMRPRCDLDIRMKGAWINRYRKGDHQEMHEHTWPDVNIAMVYFYTTNYDNSFKFHNDTFSNYASSGLFDCFDIPNMSKISPEVREGDVIMFPAHYYHMVAPNMADLERVTISANFHITRTRAP